MKKQYRATVTINVFAEAENEKEATQIFLDMGITFSHPETGNEMEQNLIDWEIKEVDNQ